MGLMLIAAAFIYLQQYEIGAALATAGMGMLGVGIGHKVEKSARGKGDG